MLKIKESKIIFNNDNERLAFKNALNHNTFKSNLNYNYLFYFLFAKGSKKSFVGNWYNENCFWIIRKEYTYFKLRPYVVCIGKFNLIDNSLTLESKIPLVSILTLILLSYFVILISFYFITVFTIIVYPIFIIIYFLLLNDEVENSLLKIKSLL